MKADELASTQISISTILLIICIYFAIRGLNLIKDQKYDRFCCIIYICFFITYALNRLLFICIDLISFESFLLKSHLQNICALILGIVAFTAFFAIIRFNDKKFSTGKKQAMIVIALSLFLSLISIFQAKEENYAHSRAKRASSYNQTFYFKSNEKNYIFDMPRGLGYKETKEIFESVYFADFTLIDKTRNFQFIMIAEVDEESTNFTIDEYINTVTQDILKKSESVEVINKQDTVIDKVEARRVNYIVTAKGVKRKLDIHFLTMNGIYYQLVIYSASKKSKMNDLQNQGDILVKYFSFISK